MNLYVDGGSKNNGRRNQKAEACLVVEDELIGIYKLGHHTNNEAEFMAVIKAFEWINKNQPDKKHLVWSDSMLVVNILNGSWHAECLRIVKIVKHLLKIKPAGVSILWLPRKMNKAGQVLEFGTIQRGGENWKYGNSNCNKNSHA